SSYLNDHAHTPLYTPSLHDALPIYGSLTIRNQTRNRRRLTIRVDIPSAGHQSSEKKSSSKHLNSSTRLEHLERAEEAFFAAPDRHRPSDLAEQGVARERLNRCPKLLLG